MLVLIEGVDRTGKSSLCELLRTQLGGMTMHWGSPQARDAVEEYVSPLSFYRAGDGRNVFVDRHYLGETVWPSIFGRPSLMTTSARYRVEGWLRGHGAVGVLATRDPEGLERACVDEPCAGQAALAQVEFQASAARSSVNWLPYEHQDPNAIWEIVHAAKLAEKEATW